jgi:peptidoglycan/LPS O-acetylase OafA/YrhL
MNFVTVCDSNSKENSGAAQDSPRNFVLVDDPAITGLRAVAVISVLLFHLGFNAFGGGYVGVDVFFAISGYLITLIILNELERLDRLDLKKFYTRRLYRLLPALLVMLLATFAASASILSVEHFSRFASSLLFAVLSGSNLLFWSERGYFDVLGDFKPLLHTWSLGVEMQFYFVWPFLLIFAWKAGRRIVALIVTVCALSFAANLMADPTSAFFLTPFRMFEFGLGALAIWGKRIRLAWWLEELALAVGLLMILMAVFSFTPKTPFPSYNALLPVLGAALAICFGRARYVGLLLRNPIAIDIGLISYSLYLVHWPLITLFRYWKFSDITLLEKLLLAGGSFILAALSYRFIEQPFRAGRFKNARSNVVLGLSISTILLIFAVEARDGWPWRFEKIYTTTLRAQEAAKVEEIKSYCRIEKGLEGNCDFKKRPRFLMLGDSHLRAWSYAFTHTFPDAQFVSLSYLGCHQALDVYPDRVASMRKEDNCIDKAEFLTNNKSFLESLDGVILTSYRPYSYSVNNFRFALVDYIAPFTRLKKAIVVGNYFQTRPNAPCDAIVVRRSSIDACLEPRMVEYVGSLERVKSEPYYAANGPKHIYLDIAGMFCPELKNCLASAEGVPALVDSDHLSHTFAAYLLKDLHARYRDRFVELGIELPH